MGKQSDRGQLESASQTRKSSAIETSAVARRVDALFKAMLHDYLLREQFITDPAQIVAEYLQRKRLPAARASVLNQLIYAVMANQGMRTWLYEYAQQRKGSMPQPEQFVVDFTKAAAKSNAYRVILAVVRFSVEREYLPLDERLITLIIGSRVVGSDDAPTTEQSTGTGTEQNTGTGTGTEQSTGTGTGTGTQQSTGTGTGTGTEQSTGTGTGTGTQQSTGTGTGTGTEQSTGTGTGTGTEQSPGTGTQISTGTGTGTGTEQSPGTGTQISTGTETGAPVTSTGTESEGTLREGPHWLFTTQYTNLTLTGFETLGHDPTTVPGWRQGGEVFGIFSSQAARSILRGLAAYSVKLQEQGALDTRE